VEAEGSRVAAGGGEKGSAGAIGDDEVLPGWSLPLSVDPPAARRVLQARSQPTLAAARPRLPLPSSK